MQLIKSHKYSITLYFVAVKIGVAKINTQEDRKIDIKEEDFDKMMALLSSLIKQNEEMLNTMRDNGKIDREIYLSTIETIEKMSHRIKSAYIYTNSVMSKVIIVFIVILLIVLYINH